MQLSKHFKSDEFKCKCCGGLPPQGISPKLINLLEEIREDLGSSIVITSGYRCEHHNTKVGGAKKSQHMDGIAADIKVTGINAHDVYTYLSEHFDDKVGGMGKYKSWTHVDVRDNRARWVG